MADTRLRFVRFIKGKYARFRHPLVGDVSLPGKPGDPAFHQAYAQYLDMVERRKQVKKEKKGTFEWLIEQYQRSAEFACLADPTQIDYNRTLAILVAELGEQPFKLTTRKMIKDVRDNFAHQPRKAHKIKQMVSRLYSWADENELVEEGFNPAGKLKKLKSKGGVKEYVVWSDQEIAWFLSAAPAHVRTPALIALYTGQRREDVASMVWNQFQGDIIRVRQSKTTALLDIACHPVLRPHLDDVKRSRKVVSLTGEADLVCRTTDGSAFTPNGLSMAIRRVVEKIPEMPNNRNIHGLRYAAGSRMDEAGCSVSEIEAVLGHRTFKVALKYAPQRLRAKSAIGKLEAQG